MLNKSYPYYLANKPVEANTDLVVTNKYTQKEATRVAQADAAALDKAIAAADKAAKPMRELKAYQRQAILQKLVDQCQDRHEELAQGLCIEAGKPIKYARGEVTRLIDTLRIGAEEAVRNYGEIQPLDISERAANYFGMWKRVPIGPCAFITPWNFPLNLVAHKIAPALAVGCPFVLKPASYTPVGALILGELLAECDLPPGAFSILPIRSDDSGGLVEDDRLKKLSFTGSAEVGWELKAKAGKKHVTLELGGNAGCIVHRDVTGPAVDDAVGRLITGCFYQSGQSCISTQRIYAHEDIYDELRDKLVAKAEGLTLGDPADEETFLGPMITADDAARAADWVSEAVDGGATLLCGGAVADGHPQANMLPATLLEDAPADAKVVREEVFAPVAVLRRYSDFDDALARVNDSRYGLQAGVFVRDVGLAMKAWDVLEQGGVLVNDVPSWRVDPMPYGGVKDSGLGREGLRWAIESMTEPRLLVIRETG